MSPGLCMVVRTERLSGPRNCRFVMYPRFSSQATDRSYGLYCGHPGPIMCWTVNETCFQAAQHRCWPLKSQCVPTARSRQPFQSFRHALAPALNRAFPCLHGGRRRCSHLPTHAMVGGCSRVPLRSHRAAERVGALPVASTVAMELQRRRESSE